MSSEPQQSSIFKKITRGLTVSSVIAGNSIVNGGPVLALGITKLFNKSKKIDQKNVEFANQWLSVNNWLIDHVLPQTQWDIRIEDDLKLDLDGRYLMMCNHQSWVDTTVNQYFGRTRMPLTRFFTKWELIFIPFVGQAFKILGFPMMKRHTKSQIAKNPALKRSDMLEARKSCEQLLTQPFTLLNYVEGTRFTAQKHKQQKSPYKHLLKPKTGGLALALSILGEKVDSLVDMTIVYPEGVPEYSQFWLGEVPKIVIHMRKVDIPDWILAGNYEEDRAFRAQFAKWLNQVWQEKDDIIETIQQDYLKTKQTA